MKAEVMSTEVSFYNAHSFHGTIEIPLLIGREIGIRMMQSWWQ